MKGAYFWMNMSAQPAQKKQRVDLSRSNSRTSLSILIEWLGQMRQRLINAVLTRDELRFCTRLNSNGETIWEIHVLSTKEVYSFLSETELYCWLDSNRFTGLR